VCLLFWRAAKAEATQGREQETPVATSNSSPPETAPPGNQITREKDLEFPVFPEARYSIVDTHLHYLNFIQETEGLEALVQKMDESGVSHVVLFGMPMAKQWDEYSPNMPTYYHSNDARAYYFSATDYIMMEHFNNQPEEIRKRFFPFVSGINPNDKFAANQIRQLLELYPGQIYGIGELMSRHDDLTWMTYGEAPRANHPALLKVYDLAAEYGLPVILHHNIAPVNNPEPVYMGELQSALEHNREANIILAHVGISRRINIPDLLERAREMLAKNENLYYDLSWIVFEEYVLEDLNGWAGLIREYPDRFMIGSDIVGYWGRYTGEITKFYVLLDLLDEETAQMVASKNILRLMNVI